MYKKCAGKVCKMCCKSKIVWILCESKNVRASPNKIAGRDFFRGHTANLQGIQAVIEARRTR